MRRPISILLLLALGIVMKPAKADFTFGEPCTLPSQVNVPGYTSAAPSISADGLSLFFISDMPGQYGNFDLWVATRKSINDDWEVPVNLGPKVNSSATELYPDISSDGLSLFFQDGHPDWLSLPRRPGGHGLGDLWVTKRETLADAWGTPENLGPTVNSPKWESTPCVTADGLALYFTSDRAGGSGDFDIWVTTRQSTSEPWDEPVNLGATVNSPDKDYGLSASYDGLALFFMSNRNGGYGTLDLWMTTRSGKDQDWDFPVNLGPRVNSSIWEYRPSISDYFAGFGCTLYFTRRPGTTLPSVIHETRINPIVDFNGDGLVDAGDMCIMVDYWGEDYSLCDIGPMPWGDGKVDVQDLTVLAEYLFQPVDDPTLVAHWPLDETEGIVAGDRVGDNDAYALGGAVWHPDGGQVGGALEFDGVDDFISAPAVLNPTDGPFSVLAWVRGGAPGQVIVSGSGGPDWLSLDLLTGSLMTDLKASGRGAGPLLSQTVIADGSWHRIGLVWDGSHRTLYVDRLAVTEDTQSDLESSASGLCIGCGDPTQPETFFSGLIDDIRIYNRAVSP